MILINAFALSCVNARHIIIKYYKNKTKTLIFSANLISNVAGCFFGYNKCLASAFSSTNARTKPMAGIMHITHFQWFSHRFSCFVISVDASYSRSCPVKAIPLGGHLHSSCEYVPKTVFLQAYRRSAEMPPAFLPQVACLRLHRNMFSNVGKHVF